MNPVNIPALAHRAHPVIEIRDGQAITISTEVARVFNKRHNDVLRAIENLLKELPADSQRNFAQTEETRPSPLNGASIKSPAYHLTRDGFTLLAMGFTGKRALAFKLAYIDAFNKMEAALTQPAQVQQALPMPETPTSGISPAVVNEIVASTTQHIVETLKQKHLLVDWQQVTAALNDSNTAITFPELTKLANAALERLQREAYTAIHQRAARQGVPTTQVSLNA